MKKKVIIISSALLLFVLLVALIISLVFNKKKDLNKGQEKFDNDIVSILTIDVNPSIEINLNKDNIVVSVVALNDDAKVVVNNSNYEKENLENVLSMLVDSLKQNNYLSDEKNLILINVDSKDENLLEMVKNKTNESLEKNKVNGEIVIQQIEETSELKELAEKNNITISKVYYIQEQIKNEEGLKVEDFKDTSITEIKEKVNNYKQEQEKKKQEEQKNNSQNNNSNNNSGRTGSNKKCEKVSVGLENEDAAKKAVSAFGATYNPSGYCDVRSVSSVADEAPNGTCAYKVEFSHRNKSCTYYINISNGEIVTSNCVNRNISINDSQCIIMKDMGVSAREQISIKTETNTGSEIVSTVEDTHGNLYEYHISNNGNINSKSLIKEAETVIAGSESD